MAKPPPRCGPSSSQDQGASTNGFVSTHTFTLHAFNTCKLRTFHYIIIPRRQAIAGLAPTQSKVRGRKVTTFEEVEDTDEDEVPAKKKAKKKHKAKTSKTSKPSSTKVCKTSEPP